ncbi:MAG: hypothetical protein ABIJ00_03185 [Candidatus Eisenbacteria bacterium]
MIKWISITLLLAVLVSGSASGLEKRPFLMKEDYGIEALTECTLQYYYYIPCPTYSWFWEMTGWQPGDIIGQLFTVGDTPTGGYVPCDTVACYTLTGVRVLDFAGYGVTYPGSFTVEFDVYCAGADGCPVGPSLWNSGPVETQFSWNEILIDPPLDLSGCYIHAGPPASTPRFLVTATHTGTDGTYPAWGFDNVGTAVIDGCAMHAFGCLPALYPRPSVSHYPTMRSGFYGENETFEYCPPERFVDGADTTFDARVYGLVELAWRVQLDCDPNATEETTWGKVKSLYR